MKRNDIQKKRSTMFAVVLVAQATGSWQVTGSTQIVPTTTSGRPDPEAIKGKMTLDEAITTYGIPQADLYAALKPHLAPHQMTFVTRSR